MFVVETTTKEQQQLNKCDITFIRHQLINKLPLVAPIFTRKLDSFEECADLCRHNRLELFENDENDSTLIEVNKNFQCHGFSYTSRDSPNSCEFFDQNTMVIFN